MVIRSILDTKYRKYITNILDLAKVQFKIQSFPKITPCRLVNSDLVLEVIIYWNYRRIFWGIIDSENEKYFFLWNVCTSLLLDVASFEIRFESSLRNISVYWLLFMFAFLLKDGPLFFTKHWLVKMKSWLSTSSTSHSYTQIINISQLCRTDVKLSRIQLLSEFKISVQFSFPLSLS